MGSQAVSPTRRPLEAPFHGKERGTDGQPPKGDVRARKKQEEAGSCGHEYHQRAGRPSRTDAKDGQGGRHKGGRSSYQPHPTEVSHTSPRHQSRAARRARGCSEAGAETPGGAERRASEEGETQPRAKRGTFQQPSTVETATRTSQQQRGSTPLSLCTPRSWLLSPHRPDEVTPTSASSSASAVPML
jgi:hypothetical protein